MKQKHDAVLLIAAAGLGSRMGGEKKKIYLPLDGKPVLAHTLKVFLDTNIFSMIIVIVAPGEKETLREQVLTPFFSGGEQIVLLEGGNQRQRSVFNGLQYLQKEQIPEDSLICIHDGARPLVSELLILNVFKEALSSGAAIAGVPLKDTIKEVDSSATVLHTPQRETLRAVQTPQCFKFSILWQAYCKAEKDNFLGSDDSSLVERLGIKVKVVPGDYKNLKITTPGDLEVAEAYLSFGRFLK